MGKCQNLSFPEVREGGIHCLLHWIYPGRSELSSGVDFCSFALLWVDCGLRGRLLLRSFALLWSNQIRGMGSVDADAECLIILMSVGLIFLTLSYTRTRDNHLILIISCFLFSQSLLTLEYYVGFLSGLDFNACQWRPLTPETGQSLTLFSLLLEDSSPAAPNPISEITASPWGLWGQARPPEGDTLTPFGRSDTVQVWTWQRHDLIHQPSLSSSWGQRACFACSSWVTKLAWL